MSYINEDIEPTLQKLRSHYHNDGTFKSYVNILVIITSHFKDLNKIYQILTKINIKTNQDAQSIRKKNLVSKENENKVIDLDKDVILENMKKLTNIYDILIYALYTLFPARRLEWRNVRITNETDTDKLDDIDTNFLIVSTNPYQIVFNEL